MVKVLLYPHFTGQYPILHSFWASFYFQMQQIQVGKNEIKMIKRDWKLPNPSYFTYTSIVQPFLQANSPFSHFSGSLFCPNAANSKREKQLQNGTKWLDLTLQGI